MLFTKYLCIYLFASQTDALDDSITRSTDTSFFFLIISIHFLHINQTRGHINRLCLICRIHRIVNSNGIRLKWRVRKLQIFCHWSCDGNLTLIFSTLKGLFIPFGINIWIEVHLFFIDWGIKSHGFKLPCISSLVVDYDA